jgi:hypothetical protein
MPTAKLTNRQIQSMEKHKKTHSENHMADMRKSMRAGDSFSKAHKKALRKVGR